MVTIALLFFVLISSCGIVQIREKDGFKTRETQSTSTSRERQIIKLSYEEHGKRARIMLRSEKSFEYRVFTLKNPSRVVIDVFADADVLVSAPKDVIHRVGKQTWGTRIVFEVPYKEVKQSSLHNGLVVDVELTDKDLKSETKEKREVSSEGLLKVKSPLRGIPEKRERGYFIRSSCDEFFRSVEDGTVLYSGNDLKTYGWVVMVDQKDGYISVYAKAGNSLVKKGEKVKRGQVLGKVGKEESGCGILYELRLSDGSPVRFELER